MYMLTNMREELLKAYKNNKAIPQFNINNLEWTRFILEECEKQNYPVILGVSEGAIEYMGGYITVVSLVKSLIEDLKISIPVSIHLDHGSSIESCIKAIKAGFTSVMLDLSNEELNYNIETTKQLVELAHPNILVESEIGPIGTELGNKKYTDVESCKKLVLTNIDLLAPAIGNKHGIYDGQAEEPHRLQMQGGAVYHGAGRCTGQWQYGQCGGGPFRCAPGQWPGTDCRHADIWQGDRTDLFPAE